MHSSKEGSLLFQNNGKKLSVAQLKKYKGLNDISDEEAEEIIDSLYHFSVLTYKIYMKSEQKKNMK